MLSKSFRDRSEQHGHFPRLEHEPEETMGRPRGSYNKEKPFKSALRVRLFDKDAKELGDIVTALIGLATKGDLQAIEKIADRLDGKVAPAAADADGPEVEPIDRIEYAVVDPKRPEGERVQVVNRDLPEGVGVQVGDPDVPEPERPPGR
jgi:hypothetical protein